VADPSLFKVVFSGLLSGDPLVRMRSADAVEKITVRHPEYLAPYKTLLLGPVACQEQQEVRWHVAQMVSRVKWSAAERKKVLRILETYLNDKSSIVKTCGMQALADLARQAPAMRPAVLQRLPGAYGNGHFGNAGSGPQASLRSWAAQCVKSISCELVKASLRQPDQAM